MDISLNEVTIHSINHSKLDIDRFYKKLESKVLRTTTELFKSFCELNSKKEMFERILFIDSYIISKMFLHRTCSLYYANITDLEVSILNQKIYGTGNPSTANIISRLSFSHLTSHCPNKGFNFDQLCNSNTDCEKTKEEAKLSRESTEESVR